MLASSPASSISPTIPAQTATAPAPEPLAVELALRLREGALVLPQPFRGGHCPPKERFLWQ